MSLPTREEFKKSLEEKTLKNNNPEWGEPVYHCPKCEDGAMRKNLWEASIMLASNPPIQQSLYGCDHCGYAEYM